VFKWWSSPFVPQDTLCALSGRQFYQDCEIYGYVDFIFGNAAAVFQWCTIHEIRNSKNGPGIIMASGRGSADDPTGLRVQGRSGAALTSPGQWRTWATVEGLLTDGVHQHILGKCE